MKEIKRITLRMQESILNEIDELIQEKEMFANRNQAIEWMLIQWLENEKHPQPQEKIFLISENNEAEEIFNQTKKLEKDLVAANFFAKKNEATLENLLEKILYGNLMSEKIFHVLIENIGMEELEMIALQNEEKAFNEKLMEE